MKFKEIKRRGQAMVLWALLTPLLILFVGVGMDLGWYYLNVSRLQNAADAAVLAGAQAVAKGIDNQYYVTMLTSNVLPEDKLEYEKIHDQNLGTLLNHKDKATIIAAMKQGRIVAEKYTRENLSDFKGVSTTVSTSKMKEISASDGWSVSSKDGDKEVSGTVNLYAKKLDVNKDQLGPMYYEIYLKENIRHFFLPGWFNDMLAPVRAVALLYPHHIDLVTIMQELERTEIIGNWEYKNQNNSSYLGKWNHYQQKNSSGGKGNVQYTRGNTYRNEGVSVTTSDAMKTSANGNKQYSVKEVDSLNIDFIAEEWKEITSTTKDFDFLSASEAKKFDFAEGWSSNVATDYRILFTANFDEAFPTRLGKKDPTPDPLWVRIESEPIKSLKYIGKGSHMAYNSVRQITLNMNISNAETENIKVDGKTVTRYKDRPLFIFYTGPEKLNASDVDENGNHVRDSQPVVINLNADFNGVIYIPESPAIINGNGHTWTGYIVAKEFLAAKTIEDYTGEFGMGDYKEVTDSYGNTLLIKRNVAVDESDVPELTATQQDGKDEKGNIIRFKSSAKHYTLITKDGTKYFSDSDGNLTKYSSSKDSYNVSDYLKVTVGDETFYIHVNDIEKTFRKVTISNEDKYFDEDTEYYQVVYQTLNGENVNPSIHDKKGNIQTKPLPGEDDSFFRPYPNDTFSQYQPGDSDWNKIVNGKEYRVYTDTDKIEVVYYRKTFNVSNDSYYSSFEVPELIRQNYTYLDSGNSDDMFFTTRRASWVD